jgi:hypothetical protein
MLDLLCLKMEESQSVNRASPEVSVLILDEMASSNFES